VRSIRRHLTGWLLAGIGTTVLTSGVVGFVVARAGLISEFDRGLAFKAQALGTLLVEHARGIELEFDDEVMPEFHRHRKPEYFQVWLDDGRTLEKSYSLLEAHADLPQLAGALNEAITLNLGLPDGRRGRAVGLVVPVDRSEALESLPSVRGRPPLATVVVARGRQGLDRAIAHLAWWLGGAVVVACLAVVGVVALAVGRGLRPLVRLGDDVAAIDAARLSARVPTEGQAREIRPLSSKLNELLARLDDAFERERRMTSNLAHELRTPIAEVRAAADVALKWPDDAVLQRDAVRTAHDVAVRMGAVVDALLRLSRTHAGTDGPDWQGADVGAIVQAALGEAARRAEARRLRVTISGAAGSCARTDPAIFGLIARNLVDNAVAHTRDGGTIASTVANGGGAVVWTIVNEPVELERSDVTRVGEPFWTKDTARSPGGHSGLGLALSRVAAAAIGVAITFEVDAGAFRATVRIPTDRSDSLAGRASE
jgi:two-component system sensor histidine kinase QseC